MCQSISLFTKNKSTSPTRRQNAFTLIELLVVIAIIALLLAIIMPALGAAKRQAQAVICRSNVRQWAVCYVLYTQENKGNFPPYSSGTVDTTYMEMLRPYYDNINKIRTCPTAAKVKTDNPVSSSIPNSFFGDTFGAWQIDTTQSWIEDDDWGIGSYGENSWLRRHEPGHWTGTNTWVKMSAVKTASRIPMFGDAKWNNAWPQDTDPIPSVNPADNTKTIFTGPDWITINTYVMRRHKKGLNVAFVDASARYLDAEQLWALKWNRSYKTCMDVDLKDLK